MLNSIFTIRTGSSSDILRGQLVKGSALLVILAVVLSSVALSLASGLAWPLLGLHAVVLLGMLIAFALAHRGAVTAAAMLVVSTIFAATSLSTLLIQTRQFGYTSFLIPILLAGLLLGANATLAFGLLSLLVIAFTAYLNGMLTTPTTTGLVIVTLVSIALAWLLIRTLETALRQARRQTEAARQAEAELRQRQASLEEANRELRAANEQQLALLNLVRDLETPAIPILDGVLALPLIGHIDTRRATHLTEAALEAVHRERARVVIIDITGVSVVDTAVAQRIEQLAQAIRLLGARVMLTGMRAEVAQTIAAQGLDFSAVETAGRLQDGVARVLSETTAHGRPAPDQTHVPVGPSSRNGHASAH